MSLLPKTNQDFAQKEYWNAFFQKRGAKAFEWYGEYLELCGHLHKYIRPKDEILVVGCGNSKLSMDLYDIGCRQITNIDISQLVINQMNELNRSQRASMKYLQMDATAMSEFNAETFSVCLDKGTLDALMPDDSPDVQETVQKYFNEIARVLRIGGRFICISLLQEHIAETLVKYFPENNFMFRAVRCMEAERKTAESSVDGTAMPVFMVIATKFQKLPFPVLEVCWSGEKMTRLTNSDEFLPNVLSIQKAALVCNGLHRGSIADMNEVSMDLYRPDDSNVRFTVHIVDQKHQRCNGKFAIFIVPQGRETEWLFSTPEGRRKLCTSSKHDRLAIVSMHRGQIYTTWDDVKAELSECVMNLAPSGLTEQIPYLSLGSEVGQRDVIFKGHSEMSGDYIVEEFTGQDGKMFRRLVFLSNQFVVQSEALVKTIKTKKRTSIERVIDPNYLACQHHLFMSVGVNAMALHLKKARRPIEIAVIGLGGGGLCTFVHRCIRNVKITAVDIDPIILSIATKYFGLIQDDRLAVVIDDGIKFLQDAANAERKFDAILFDVDSKDPTLGMSCPPKSFLDANVLNAVKQCIGDQGMFILNLVCRNEQLRDEVFGNLRNTFKSVCSYKLEEDVNEILYIQNTDSIKSLEKWRNEIEAAASGLNEWRRKVGTDELVEVQELLRDLSV